MNAHPIVESSSRPIGGSKAGKMCSKAQVKREILIELIKAHNKTFNPEGGRLDFESLLGGLIERKLKETLGEAVSNAIKRHLEEKFSLTMGDAAKKPEEFFSAMGNIFGRSATTLESLIIKELQKLPAPNQR